MDAAPSPSTPFRSPVFLLDQTVSTMEDARAHARAGAPHGTAVIAQEQSAGRGRFRDRRWEGQRGKDLLVTFLFEAKRIGLAGFPLRVGLGLCRAVDRLAGCSRPQPEIAIKWPNDLLLGGRKAAGILCEASGGFLYAGIGVNCRARAFPPGLRTMPVSLEEFLGRSIAPMEFFPVLAQELRRALEDGRWREEVEARLYLRGQAIRFQEADPERGRSLEGILYGLGPEGEIVLELPGGQRLACATGEILLAASAALG